MYASTCVCGGPPSPCTPEATPTAAGNRSTWTMWGLCVRVCISGVCARIDVRTVRMCAHLRVDVVGRWVL